MIFNSFTFIRGRILSLKIKNRKELRNRYKFEAELFPASVPAGLSEISDELPALDLNEFLAPNPRRMFMVHVNGESMIDENIDDGDILIVDSGAQPYDGKIVVASLNGELTVKTFREKNGRAWLISANKKFLPIEIGELVQFEIQGVVKHVIKKMH